MKFRLKNFFAVIHSNKTLCSLIQRVNGNNGIVIAFIEVMLRQLRQKKVRSCPLARNL